MTAEDSGVFWNWSLSRYEAEGVAPLLLQLQDDYNLSVNILLWCAWCAQRFEAIPESTLVSATNLAARWSKEVGSPLRKARRALKSPPAQADAVAASELRSDVKAAELAAEKIEQFMLERLAVELLEPSSDSEGAAARLDENFAAYTKLAATDQHGEEFSALLKKLAVQLLQDRQAADRDGAAHE